MNLFTIDNLPSSVALLLLGQFVGTFSIDEWRIIVQQILIPMYGALVSSYIVLRIFHVAIEPRLKTDSAAKEHTAATTISIEEAEEANAPQPVDMTGIYKLVENENYEDFLAAQGVPWALRAAADKARPTHKFTHKGNILLVQIKGIIESESKYHIGGPPTETAVRGRQFRDTMTYLDDKTGVQTLKRAINDGYTVRVCRRLSPDKSTLTMTSTVYFDEESKESVECRQILKKIDD